MIRIAARTIRGIWFTELGQTVEEWMPPGVYTPNGHENLTDGRPVVAMLGDTGSSWYIPESIYAKIKSK